MIVESKLTGLTPSRVVALGGGTGLPAVLRGLRAQVRLGELNDVVAVVTMTDDGGSSGRLRRSRGLPPPGDLRNCLVALAAEEDLMAELYQYRYGGEEGLGGHTVGNLILAALAERTGSFLKAVELSSRVLRVVGRILPATLETTSLKAEMSDGSVVVGETSIAASSQKVRHMMLEPATAAPTPGVVDAVREADIVVIGPGSLYTSLVPNVLVGGVGQALRETSAVVVFVANLVSERGEDGSLGLDDHLRVLEAHAGGAFIDAVVMHRGEIAPEIRARYEAEGTHPLAWEGRVQGEVEVVRGNLLAEGGKLRHDPDATVAALLTAWRTVRIGKTGPRADAAAASQGG